jgi:hypothetical protein
MSALKPSISCLSRSRIIVIVLLTALLISPFVSSLQAVSAPYRQWDKTYGPIVGHSMMQTFDGGYAIAGAEGVWQTSRGPGDWANVTFLLIKTDSSGQVQWRKNYARGGLQSAVLTSDGGYALVGYGDESNLVKVDSEGNAQWSKNYSALSDSTPCEVVQTQDGGYAIAGYANPGYGSEGRLVKIDANGNFQWNKTYGAASQSNSVYSLVEAKDGGFAMAGITEYQSHGDLDAWLVKTDSMGNLEWEKSIGGADQDYASSLIVTADGGYLLVGYTESFGAGDDDGWLVKTDSQGNVIWNVAYGSTGRDSFSSVAQTADGEYVAAGAFNALIKSSAATVVVKIDMLGNVKWDITYQNRRSKPLSIMETQDGGYAFTGYKALGIDQDITDVWFVKNTPPSDFQGAPSGFQETRSPSEPQGAFPTTWIVIAIVIVVAGLGLGLLFYLWKRNR